MEGGEDGGDKIKVQFKAVGNAPLLKKTKVRQFVANTRVLLLFVIAPVRLLGARFFLVLRVLFDVLLLA